MSTTTELIDALLVHHTFQREWESCAKLASRPEEIAAWFEKHLIGAADRLALQRQAIARLNLAGTPEAASKRAQKRDAEQAAVERNQVAYSEFLGQGIARMAEKERERQATTGQPVNFITHPHPPQ